MMFSRSWFFALDKQLRASGLDSDAQTFDEILDILQKRKKFAPDDFAAHVIYVILAGGFSQQTAKNKHLEIMTVLNAVGADYEILMHIFANKNKINAICKVWNFRQRFCSEYYVLKTLDERLAYLQTLPHVGKITANHLARNLGEDVVKYDIWIQRLGCVFADKKLPVDNAKLSPEIKAACDDMFAHLVGQTGLPRGYIDVVLWRSLQQGLIKL